MVSCSFLFRNHTHTLPLSYYLTLLKLNHRCRNFDTHVTSSCHRIKVYSINRNRADTRARLQELEARGLSMTPITQPLTFDLETEEHYQEVMKLRGGRDPKE